MSKIKREKEKRRKREAVLLALGGLTTRKLPDKLNKDITCRALPVVASSIDKDAMSVEAVITTESRAAVMDFKQFRIIDEVLVTSGMRAIDQVPALDSHFRFSNDFVIGSAREIRAEGDKVVARVFFVRDDPDVLKQWRKVEQGHIRDFSAGYRVDKFVDIPAGQSKVVLGKRYQAGERVLRITTEWTLREASLVPIGADEFAKVRSEHGEKPKGKVQVMNEKLRKHLEGLGLRADSSDAEAWTFYDGLEEGQRAEAATLRAAMDTLSPSPAPTPVPAQDAARAAATDPVPVDKDAIRAEGAQQERARVDAIRALAVPTTDPKLVERAISENWNKEKTAEEFLGALRKSTPDSVGSRIVVGEEGGNSMVRAIEAGISLTRFGEVPEASAARTEAERFEGMGLRDAARMIVEAETGKRGHLSPDALFKRAVSTQNLPILLGNLATKSLAKAYQETPDTLAIWTGERSVADFKEYTDVRLTDLGDMEEVGDSGELKHDGIAESTETYKARTYGKLVTLSRVQFINDDLGGFLRIPAKMGQAASRKLQDLGYDLLTSASGVGPTLNEDSTALFATTRATPNYLVAAVANSGINDIGLTAMKKLMRKIKFNDTHLNLTPKFLLAPPELEDAADRFMQSRDSVPKGSTDVQVADKNIHQGAAQVIIEPRLSGKTNGTTAWYLFADPNAAETIVRVFLNGRKTPFFQRKDPANVLGLGWQIYFDAGVAATDWRGGVRSKGAA